MEELLSQGMFEPKATPEQTAALERLEQLMGRASHLRGRGVHRTGTDAGLTCTMTTQAGHNTVITSPAGRLTLLDTVVVVEPHAEPFVPQPASTPSGGSG